MIQLGPQYLIQASQRHIQLLLGGPLLIQPLGRQNTRPPLRIQQIGLHHGTPVSQRNTRLQLLIQLLGQLLDPRQRLIRLTGLRHGILVSQRHTRLQLLIPPLGRQAEVQAI
jgi:hypothetical protein